MATTNSERVGKALELLRDGIASFVDREFRALDPADAVNYARRCMKPGETMLDISMPLAEWDVASLLKIMWDAWNEVFKSTLGYAERTLVSELRDVRNKWAHQRAFSYDDTYRALDSASRLLSAISAPQVQELESMKEEVMRVKFQEQARVEKRKNGATLIKTQSSSGLKAWREIVAPHPDVAGGNFQQAEFAADLWQVYLGQGSPEYRDPEEFFRRTFITQSLKYLLGSAAKRLSGKGGDPVVQLQTNFGGGKTHSMLALFHLFSGISPTKLPNVEPVLEDLGIKELPTVRRVVLVGNKISPGNPSIKEDGTEVRTLWGELAWQLGGKKAFSRIAEDDKNSTNPGDVLRKLMDEYGPCLILIDEWVAYARQLHDASDLPGGSFETHFTFAQALTESAKLAKHCLLVISLPASDSASNAYQADNVEVGGERGRAALDRLQNVIGRLESTWKPATSEEGFEIVRRRLFEPMTGKEQFVARDLVVDAFYKLYKDEKQEFPTECSQPDYKRRLEAAYPIHPEVFDRLYTDWSSLVKFQRTRGVLRLMAAVIHSLWEKGDANPLIMPANISIDDQRVQFELTRYLSDNWTPVIEKDVDGPNSLPRRLDSENSNLGKYLACRRVARTIYLGSAPTNKAANVGIEDRRIKLGCVMPGEPPAVFGDALRRLAASATYLYPEGNRYWYSTQPTVTKLADDRAQEYSRNEDALNAYIEALLQKDLRDKGDFSRIHALPQSSQDIPDDQETRLVVLGPEQAHVKDTESPALIAAKKLLEMRGSSPRMYRNTLVFLAPDKTRMQDLGDAVAKALAWESIVREKDSLNLTGQQAKQAQEQEKSAQTTAASRIPECFHWLLVPLQHSATDKGLSWECFRLTGQDGLAARAAKKLKNEEYLMPSLGGSRLKMEIDKVPLWRGNHVAIRTLAEDFGKYLYLPRLTAPHVLAQAISSGLGLLTWRTDTFAYAESYDEAAGRYRGLRCGLTSHVSVDDPGLLVKPDVAAFQEDEERQAAAKASGITTTAAGTSPEPGMDVSGQKDAPQAVRPQPKRYHGSIELDPNRVGRDAEKIAEEVIAHLGALVGAKVTVTLDIEAVIPEGAPENIVRTVTENGNTLGFTDNGFEVE